MCGRSRLISQPGLAGLVFFYLPLSSFLTSKATCGDWQYCTFISGLYPLVGFYRRLGDDVLFLFGHSLQLFSKHPSNSFDVFFLVIWIDQC